MISAQTLCICREGKPVSTFPDHALASSRRRCQGPRQDAYAWLQDAVWTLQSACGRRGKARSDEIRVNEV